MTVFSIGLITRKYVNYDLHHHVLAKVPKLVVVDNTYVSMGGIDLCFGRWDNHNQ